jgi:hypothetical protein
VGASGVVFGYLGYILVRGFFDRHATDIMIGAVMALCFAYQFTVLLPHAGIGWQAHIGGLAAGVVGGWIFRDRRSTAGKRAMTTTPTRVTRPAGLEPGSATLSLKSAAQANPAQNAGPRAELHKQLDDLGL